MPTGGSFALGTYITATGGDMEENGRNISDGHAAPIQTSSTYVGMAQKVFNFATAADAAYWAYLQALPICKVFDNNGDLIASAECDYENDGTSAIVRAIFTTRVHTQGATGINNAYFFRFVDIEADMSPNGISIYH